MIVKDTAYYFGSGSGDSRFRTTTVGGLYNYELVLETIMQAKVYITKQQAVISTVQVHPIGT